MSKHFPRSTPKYEILADEACRTAWCFTAMRVVCLLKWPQKKMPWRGGVQGYQVAGLVLAPCLTDHPCWQLAVPTPSLRGLVKSWLGGWNISIVCFSGMPSSCSELASCLPTPCLCLVLQCSPGLCWSLAPLGRGWRDASKWLRVKFQ